MGLTSSEGSLSGVGHHVGLVEDDQLEALPVKGVSKKGRRVSMTIMA